VGRPKDLTLSIKPSSRKGTKGTDTAELTSGLRFSKVECYKIVDVITARNGRERRRRSKGIHKNSDTSSVLTMRHGNATAPIGYRVSGNRDTGVEEVDFDSPLIVLR
jgi:hypothetical protein